MCSEAMLSSYCETIIASSFSNHHDSVPRQSMYTLYFQHLVGPARGQDLCLSVLVAHTSASPKRCSKKFRLMDPSALTISRLAAQPSLVPCTMHCSAMTLTLQAIPCYPNAGGLSCSARNFDIADAVAGLLMLLALFSIWYEYI